MKKLFKAMRITSGFDADGKYFQEEHYYNETYFLLEDMSKAGENDRFYKMEQLTTISEAKEFATTHLYNPDLSNQLGKNFLDKFTD